MAERYRNTVQVVRIDNVDISKNEVHCVSKDGGRFTLKIPIANGFYRIPKSGENWVVRREDLTNWYFEGVMTNDNPYGAALPQEGDVVVEAKNNINLNANSVFINNIPFGPMESEEFDVDGGEYQITLQNTPIPNMIQVFSNGLLIAPSGIIIREQTILFNDPLSTGKIVVYYTRSPER